MRIADELDRASRRLESVSDEARLEAEVLFGRALDVDRTALLARLQEALDTAVQDAFRGYVQRRLAHEPTAYITGTREFFGFEIECSPAALVPRPETELLVEQSLEWIERRQSASNGLRVVEIGTGSGAISVALAKSVPGQRLLATDISVAALALASQNAHKHCVAGQIDFLQGSLLAPLRGPFDLIVANLPYIPTRAYNALPPEIREHEPEAALRAGRRGIAVIEALLSDAVERLRPGGLLLAEHAWNQGNRLRAAAKAHYPTAGIETLKDLAGLDRVLAVRTGS